MLVEIHIENLKEKTKKREKEIQDQKTDQSKRQIMDLGVIRTSRQESIKTNNGQILSFIYIYIYIYIYIDKWTNFNDSRMC